MAKTETSSIGKYVLLPFLPQGECEILGGFEVDFSEHFHLPEKPKFLYYDILLFRDGFRTNFILVPTSKWAIKQKKEKEKKHFLEGWFEEMIAVSKENDDATEEVTDGPTRLLEEEFGHMPRKNGPIRSFFRGSSVFLDEDEPALAIADPQAMA
jgi:hypothetical protein